MGDWTTPWRTNRAFAARRPFTGAVPQALGSARARPAPDQRTIRGRGVGQTFYIRPLNRRDAPIRYRVAFRSYRPSTSPLTLTMISVASVWMTPAADRGSCAIDHNEGMAGSRRGRAAHGSGWVRRVRPSSRKWCDVPAVHGAVPRGSIPAAQKESLAFGRKAADSMFHVEHRA